MDYLQKKLSSSQIKAFYVDCFSDSQVFDFMALATNNENLSDRIILDVGGGFGYFAQALHKRAGCHVRVVDSDPISIDSVCQLNNINIEGIVGNALLPDIRGDEDIVCFNLILHHLIGPTEAQTRLLQKNALLAWKNANVKIFVNEYIYDSYIGTLSGRLIYEITSSKFFSYIGRIIATIVPSLRANTFGIGVRFRAHSEWRNLFEECGFTVSSSLFGVIEHTAIPRRLLFVKQIRRDSFLLVNSYK